MHEGLVVRAQRGDREAFASLTEGRTNRLYTAARLILRDDDGDDLVYCSGKIGQDFFNGNATWSMVCNMTGGASGGPLAARLQRIDRLWHPRLVELVPVLLQ